MRYSLIQITYNTVPEHVAGCQAISSVSQIRPRTDHRDPDGD